MYIQTCKITKSPRLVQTNVNVQTIKSAELFNNADFQKTNKQTNKQPNKPDYIYWF